MSVKPGAPQTIEQFAAGVLALADALYLDRLAVLGHPTGTFVATEVTSAQPERVTAAVFSAGELGDDEFRAHDEVRVDVAPVQEDVLHLTTLWALRRPVYPKDRPACWAGSSGTPWRPGRPAGRHLACTRCRMEGRAHLVTAPVLFLAPTEDPVSHPHTERPRTAFPASGRRCSGPLPPSSRATRLRLPANARKIAWPVAVDSVKLTGSASPARSPAGSG